MAWTQSVTRGRWLAVKLAVVGVVGIALTGLVSLTITRWAGLYDRVNEQAFDTFDRRDIVPMGHAAFAFALGVTAGVVLRRLLPAMATTLVVFVAVRLVTTTWIRPNLLPHKVLTSIPDPSRTGFGSVDGGAMTLQPDGPRLPNAWFHSVDLVDAAGHALTPDDVAKACPQLTDFGGPPPGGKGGVAKAPDGLGDALQQCVTKIGRTFNEVVTYHPADRYWPLQWLEVGVYAAAALLLLGLATGWLRRRAA